MASYLNVSGFWGMTAELLRAMAADSYERPTRLSVGRPEIRLTIYSQIKARNQNKGISRKPHISDFLRALRRGSQWVPLHESDLPTLAKPLGFKYKYYTQSGTEPKPARFAVVPM